MRTLADHSIGDGFDAGEAVGEYQDGLSCLLLALRSSLLDESLDDAAEEAEATAASDREALMARELFDNFQYLLKTN